jgi:excinuclease ABC subunit B
VINLSVFNLVSPFVPKGDQIKAIDDLINNINDGKKEQILLGATGTGKTFTIANIIQKMGKKTLIMAPNKTLAGQLYAELLAFFPHNHVEYFISYYDYYQPEAYVVSSDTHIDKDATVNDEIDQLRNRATSSLIHYDDTIVVASVSCIYGIGSPDDYEKLILNLRVNEEFKRSLLLDRLVELTYKRNDIDFVRGSFRVRGDNVDIILPSERSVGVRIVYFEDIIEEIKIFEVVTGKILDNVSFISINPATLFMTDKERMKEAISRIENELEERLTYFKQNNKLLEAERISLRTKYDCEMLKEIGIVAGIENYSRHLALRGEGETPDTLINFFKKDFLLIIDESHVTIPQIGGMYLGDRSRKQTLVDYGFRLPSALDNLQHKYSELEKLVDKFIYLSSTPGKYELEKNLDVIEQIIRPTYLLDPKIEIKPTLSQVDDLYYQIKERAGKGERVLVTTLTIKMSEDLTKHFKNMGIKAAYLHSEIKSLERLKILADLRRGKFDCLIGINLLREGLDLPEVSLVAIMDADKQGFLRSTRSLIQTIGRAARNSNGSVIMYADKISDSMQSAIDETNRRRRIQQDFNEKNGTTPTTIFKEIRDSISLSSSVDEKDSKVKTTMSKKERDSLIKSLEAMMQAAAKELDFERAMELRDAIYELKASL